MLSELSARPGISMIYECVLLFDTFLPQSGIDFDWELDGVSHGTTGQVGQGCRVGLGDFMSESTVPGESDSESESDWH
jgi:hypothetical protein